jgi:hypothetical protein
MRDSERGLKNMRTEQPFCWCSILGVLLTCDPCGRGAVLTHMMLACLLLLLLQQLLPLLQASAAAAAVALPVRSIPPLVNPISKPPQSIIIPSLTTKFCIHQCLPKQYRNSHPWAFPKQQPAKLSLPPAATSRHPSIGAPNPPSPSSNYR